MASYFQADDTLSATSLVRRYHRIAPHQSCMDERARHDSGDLRSPTTRMDVHTGPSQSTSSKWHQSQASVTLESAATAPTPQNMSKCNDEVKTDILAERIKMLNIQLGVRDKNSDVEATVLDDTHIYTSCDTPCVSTHVTTSCGVTRPIHDVTKMNQVQAPSASQVPKVAQRGLHNHGQEEEEEEKVGLSEDDQNHDVRSQYVDGQEDEGLKSHQLETNDNEVITQLLTQNQKMLQQMQQLISNESCQQQNNPQTPVVVLANKYPRPTFAGKNDKLKPSQFVTEFEKYALLNDVHVDTALQQEMPAALRGDAWEWWKLSEGFQKFSTFKKALVKEFTDINYRIELSQNLNQRTQHENEKLSAYIRCMNAMYDQCDPEATDETRINRIIDQCHPSVQPFVVNQSFTSVADMAKYASKVQHLITKATNHKPPPPADTEFAYITKSPQVKAAMKYMDEDRPSCSQLRKVEFYSQYGDVNNEYQRRDSEYDHRPARGYEEYGSRNKYRDRNRNRERYVDTRRREPSYDRQQSRYNDERYNKHQYREHDQRNNNRSDKEYSYRRDRNQSRDKYNGRDRKYRDISFDRPAGESGASSCERIMTVTFQNELATLQEDETEDHGISNSNRNDKDRSITSIRNVSRKKKISFNEYKQQQISFSQEEFLVVVDAVEGDNCKQLSTESVHKKQENVRYSSQYKPHEEDVPRRQASKPNAKSEKYDEVKQQHEASSRSVTMHTFNHRDDYGQYSKVSIQEEERYGRKYQLPKPKHAYNKVTAPGEITKQYYEDRKQ